MKTVINLSGEREPFSYKKVKRSATGVGADEKTAKKIAKRIENEAYDGMETKEIYGKVKSYLKKEAPQAALKFSVRKAIEKLGPTGFPFEKFAGEIFKDGGYKMDYNRMVRGRCIEHEIDFIAENEDEVILAECKYRHGRGNKIDIGDALKAYASFSDIENGRFTKKKRFMLVTNEKFTSKVARYGSCVGLELLGWKHPKGRGIEYFMDEKGLYPITILPSLNKEFVGYFVKRKKMLAKDVLKMDIDRLVEDTSMARRNAEALKEEAKTLLG